MKKMKFIPHLIASLAVTSALASTKMVPDNPVNDFARRSLRESASVVSDGAGPRLRMISPKAMPNMWDVQCSIDVPVIVKKGDMIVVTFAARGKSAFGNARWTVKLQDRKNIGLLRHDIQSGPEWKLYRYAETALRDYTADELSIGLFYGHDRQTVEMSGFTLENHGAISKDALPAPPALPKWKDPEITAPDPEKPME
ncbi:MAG: hypothetical protein GX804_07850 [Lentisphaerae bacterium]|nr:hypothetical protein [Lentisphaerota bacterium]